MWLDYGGGYVVALMLWTVCVSTVWMIGVVGWAFITDAHAMMPKVLRWIPFRSDDIGPDDLIDFVVIFKTAVCGFLFSILNVMIWPVVLFIGMMYGARHLYRQKRIKDRVRAEVARLSPELDKIRAHHSTIEEFKLKGDYKPR